MKLTAKVKLLPTPEQYQLLHTTLRTVNHACDWASAVAFGHGVYPKYDLQPLIYGTLREEFNLSAQVAIHTIVKVAYAYKVGSKEKQYTFHPHGAIAYDDRILKWYAPYRYVSIWLMGGRQKIAFVCGERDYALLQSQSGESDLCFVDGEFYLYTTCEVEIPDPTPVSEYLGVDLGVANIATDSDGHFYSGKQVNALRHRHRRLRQKLQKKGTRSARRKLRQRRRKEARFAKDINHCISKQLVQCAKDTRAALPLKH